MWYLEVIDGIDIKFTFFWKDEDIFSILDDVSIIIGMFESHTDKNFDFHFYTC